MSQDPNKKGLKITLSGASKLFFIIALLLFTLTQLITNAILSPLGHELQSMNFEKNALIEDNRQLEQEIAKDTSITIIQVYSADKFEIRAKTNHKSVYVTDPSIQAQK